MISRLLFPWVVRRETYSLVRWSRAIRTTQIRCSARLASRLPPRLSLCLTTFPEEASMGETPQRLAKEASLLRRSVLSPATISSVAAWLVPMAGRETRPGAASATSRSNCHRVR